MLSLFACELSVLSYSKIQDKSFSVKFRIPFMPREKRGYLILRRAGLSINQIATCFGRSTSVVHRTLHRLLSRYREDRERIGDRSGRILDMRKLPHSWKMKNSAKRRSFMMDLREAWSEWVTSEEGDPP